jgi:UDP-N-acetylglucosamine 2-epimerase (non-hydrolysing)
MKIINVVGARPNLPKIAPLIRLMCSHPEIEPILVHTGQHYDDQLSDVFFRQMGLPTPHYNLQVGSGSHAVQTAEVLKRIEPGRIEQKPNLVLVVGDVNSTAAATLAAVKLGVSVAHVEAGLRSFDRSMPEEINRILTDALADYLFVTEEDAVENLLKEGRPRSSIHFVGNVMIDTLLHFLPIAQTSRIGHDLDLICTETWRRFAVLTLHRPSNVDTLDRLRELLRAVNLVAMDVPVIFPVHPRTAQRLCEANIALAPGLRLTPPMGYLDFLCLLSHAALVLTDSGGIQEETTALAVPCLTLRENTERPVTISKGTNVLVGTDVGRIVQASRNVLAGDVGPSQVPPLWDGRAAERIVEVLLRLVANHEPVMAASGGAHTSS